MKEFLEFIETNEEAKAKVQALDAKPDAKLEDYIALAKEYGFEISENDFVSVEAKGTELSEDELDTVAGGGFCACAWGGGGTGYGTYTLNGKTYNELTCACVLGGGGEYIDPKGERECRCVCVIAGTGWDADICGGGNGADG